MLTERCIIRFLVTSVSSSFYVFVVWRWHVCTQWVWFVITEFVINREGTIGVGDVFWRRQQTMDMWKSSLSESSQSRLYYWGPLSSPVTYTGCDSCKTSTQLPSYMSVYTVLEQVMTNSKETKKGFGSSIGKIFLE